MSIAAGGKILQNIVKDKMGQEWLPKSTTFFNVQVMNSAVYRSVTGRDPPTQPIGVDMYEQHGLPFFKMYEEPSNVHGNFAMVKSVAELEEK